MMEKQGGLSKLSIAYLNEERRKRKKLPPLSNLDYNCMDRASIKLKKVLDALQIERTMAGTRLVPRSIKQMHKQQKYSEKVSEVYYKLCIKLD